LLPKISHKDWKTLTGKKNVLYHKIIPTLYLQ
jgi:hypothetical protein